mmetsp:Transcript_15708/g.37908  ORF Transcript_15708/g.37908 Transcript_15708/m.37908 type:complete len:247 (-) Transcript_15708:1535-2275(-)
MSVEAPFGVASPRSPLSANKSRILWVWYPTSSTNSCWRSSDSAASLRRAASRSAPSLVTRSSSLRSCCNSEPSSTSVPPFAALSCNCATWAAFSSTCSLYRCASFSHAAALLVASSTTAFIAWIWVSASATCAKESDAFDACCRRSVMVALANSRSACSLVTSAWDSWIWASLEGRLGLASRAAASWASSSSSLAVATSNKPSTSRTLRRSACAFFVASSRSASSLNRASSDPWTACRASSCALLT